MKNKSKVSTIILLLLFIVQITNICCAEQSIKYPGYLGNDYRRYYGKGPVPKKLNIIWKKYVGGGKTKVGKKDFKWFGTGWPGQMTLVEEDGVMYALFGSYSYDLWKVNATTGKTVWKHKFNNIIKGTPILWKDTVLCGSRADYGVPFSGKMSNFRCVSLSSGTEQWRWGVPLTDSYSRDLDAAGIIVDDILYTGAENGMLYKIKPGQKQKPEILSSLKLYTKADAVKHKGNLVIESFPVMSGDQIFVSAGSGHVYGINLKKFEVTWDFYIGSDIDSTPVITRNNNLLVGIEKQYIKGNGGVFCLTPSKKESDCVNWYFPVENAKFARWEGGIIGTVSINDEYNSYGNFPALAAFCAIDGNLYVVSQKVITGKKILGPDNKTLYDSPYIIMKDKIGASISTPIFVDDYLIACGYSGIVHVYQIEASTNVQQDCPGVIKNENKVNCIVTFKEITSIKLNGSIESTPLVWEGRIFIGCRDGYFYCLGEN